MLASIIKLLQTRKDLLALLIAAVLSIVFAKIVFSSGLAVGSTFLVCSFLLSFIVSFVSDKNTVLIAVIANVIFIVSCLLQKYLILAQPFFGWTSETSVILMVLSVVSLFLAFAISGAFTLIRKETGEF